MKQFINRIFNRIQVKDSHALKNKYYVYINGVAYMRSGTLIAMCDYTLPPRKQKWKLILDPKNHPEITQVAYALALIEGAIKIHSHPFSAGFGLN